jgi:hypothetical protein
MPTPTRVVDAAGRQQVVPNLSEMALVPILSDFRRVGFKFVWKGFESAVFSTAAGLNEYQRKAVIRDAAEYFCRTLLRMDRSALSNRKLANTYEFRTIWHLWRSQQCEWDKQLDEAEQLLAVQEVMSA